MFERRFLRMRCCWAVFVCASPLPPKKVFRKQLLLSCGCAGMQRACIAFLPICGAENRSRNRQFYKEKNFIPYIHTILPKNLFENEKCFSNSLWKQFVAKNCETHTERCKFSSGGLSPSHTAGRPNFRILSPSLPFSPISRCRAYPANMQRKLLLFPICCAFTTSLMHQKSP